MNIGLDLDGTLITCEPKQSACLLAVLNRHGLKNIDVGDIWEQKRNGVSTYDALIGLNIAPTLSLKLSQEWKAIIEEPFWLQMDSVFPDIKQAIAKMLSHGAKCYLVTARARPEWVYQELSRHKLITVFEDIAIVSPSNGINEKANQLKKFKTCVFFGDTVADYLAAKLANIPFLAVNRGQRNNRALEKGGIHNVSSGLSAAWEDFLLGKFSQ